MRWNLLLPQVLGVLFLGCSSGQGADGGSPGTGGGPSGADPEFAAWDPYPGPCVEIRYRKNVQLDDGPTDVVEENTRAYELDDLGRVSLYTFARTSTLVDGTSEVTVSRWRYGYEDAISVCSPVQPPLRFEATSCPSSNYSVDEDGMQDSGITGYSYNDSGQMVGIGGAYPVTFTYSNGLLDSEILDFSCDGGGWEGEFEWLSSRDLAEVSVFTFCPGEPSPRSIRAERLYHYDERGNLVAQEETQYYVDTGELRNDAEITYDYTCWEN